MAGEGLVLDWVNLPSSLEPESLWHCLHDAALESIRSDTLGRSLTLSFDVGYLRKHHRLPEDLRFLFLVTGVRSVRAVTFAHWPGPGPDTSGTSYEEQRRLMSEYQSKGREESASWKEFEANLPQASFLVYNADLASASHAMALRIEGTSEDSDWYAIYLQAEELSVHRSDGAGFSVDEFQKLGEAYWDRFARKSEDV